MKYFYVLIDPNNRLDSTVLFNSIRCIATIFDSPRQLRCHKKPIIPITALPRYIYFYAATSVDRNACDESARQLSLIAFNDKKRIFMLIITRHKRLLKQDSDVCIHVYINMYEANVCMLTNKCSYIIECQLIQTYALINCKLQSLVFSNEVYLDIKRRSYHNLYLSAYHASV